MAKGITTEELWQPKLGKCVYESATEEDATRVDCLQADIGIMGRTSGEDVLQHLHDCTWQVSIFSVAISDAWSFTDDISGM